VQGLDSHVVEVAGIESWGRHHIAQFTAI